MDLELTGNAALVTGGARGIGAAVALALAREGCQLTLVDRDREGAEAVARAITALGRQARVVTADVADWARAEAVVSEARAAHGRLDILCCVAGITRDAVSWKMTEEDWDAVIDVNLKGFFTYCRVAARLFKEQQGGKIVTLGSINGLRGKFGQANYAAAKAGGFALVKTLAKELGRFNVNVNGVAPGLVTTEMTQKMPADAFAQAVAETALGRAATVDDVAALVVFLCSPRARHITGEIVRVDGGQYI